MKILLSALLVSVVSCSIPLYATQDQPAESAETISGAVMTQEGGHDSSHDKSFEVMADVALRVRDMPEEWGGSELTTIPRGDFFRVYACMDVQGTAWAFGSYTDSHGKHWVGYAAARYLSDIDCMEEK
jgi:hypothetical protein